jgi:hypothetical protein
LALLLQMWEKVLKFLSDGQLDVPIENKRRAMG